MRVLCNHNNLRYFITTKSLSTYQAQYAKELAKFNFKIKYKPGKANPANTLSQHLNYAKGFKDGSKRTVFNAILPILQQKLQVIGLIGGPSTTIPHQQVACVQYISNPCKLIALNSREDPLAQATAPYNNLVSHLRIIHYFTGTDFVQSLILQ